MDKFNKLLNKEKIKDIKTLAGVVMFTIKLCKKSYKSKCDKEIIKASISLVIEKLNTSHKLPEGFDKIINSVTEEEINDLIDDFYDSYDCFKNVLKSISCKKQQIVNEPVTKRVSSKNVIDPDNAEPEMILNKELNVEVSQV